MTTNNMFPEDLAVRFQRMREWVDGYHDQLTTIAADISLTLGSPNQAPFIINYAVDFYDLYSYMFPLIDAANRRQHITDPKIRGQIVHDLAARACMLWNTPTKGRLYLLPPHEEELTAVLHVISQATNRALLNADLLPLLAPVMHELRKRYSSNEVTQDSGQWLQFVTEHFGDYIFLITGVYSDGLRLLKRLFDEDRVSRLTSEMSDDRILAGPPVRRDSGTWLSSLNEVRPRKFVPNERDARAIEIVIRLNQYLAREKQLYILVAGADALQVILRNAAIEDVTIMHDDTPITTIWRSLEYFHVLFSLRETSHSGQLDESLLDTVNEQLSQAASYRLEYDRAYERMPSDTISEDDSNWKPLRERLDVLESRQSELANLRLFEHGEDGLLRLSMAETSNNIDSAIIQESIRSLMKLRKDKDFAESVSKSILTVEKDLLETLHGIEAQKSVLTRMPQQGDIESLGSFPIWVNFTDPELKTITSQIQALVRNSRQPINVLEIRELLRRLGARSENPNIRMERKLVWAVLLLAYRHYRPAAMLTESAHDGGDDSLDETIAFVHAFALCGLETGRSRLEAVNCLRSDITRHPQSPILYHMLSYSIGSWIVRPGSTGHLGEFRLSHAIDYGYSAIKLRSADEWLNASLWNNRAYYLAYAARQGESASDLEASLHAVSKLQHCMNLLETRRSDWLETIGFVYRIAASLNADNPVSTVYRNAARVVIEEAMMSTEASQKCREEAARHIAELDAEDALGRST